MVIMQSSVNPAPRNQHTSASDLYKSSLKYIHVQFEPNGCWLGCIQYPIVITVEPLPICATSPVDLVS